MEKEQNTIRHCHHRKNKFSGRKKHEYRWLIFSEVLDLVHSRQAAPRSLRLSGAHGEGSKALDLEVRAAHLLRDPEGVHDLDDTSLRP